MARMKIAFDDRGLVPVIAQDHLTGEIRMLAFATQEAIVRTLETKRATFFSRSRNAIWEKGESSGNAMDVVSVLLDCDADAVVYLVAPRGPTCHTGAPSCFFREIEEDLSVREEVVRPQVFLARLEAVLDARKSATAKASYTKSLYDGGPAKIGEKLREEAAELAAAVAGEDEARVASEAADLLFHLLVALRSRDVPFEAVLRELDHRSGTSGHDEKLSRKP
jgi:phosphoribosyl-ATP pyrophosphohydrolase/phosphoribosyl-AMP cyclohydrolase